MPNMQQKPNEYRTAYGFGVVLSGCARDYIRCLADPTPSGPLACVPSPYPNFSFRQRCHAKFTFSVGNLFEGWVVFDPVLSLVKGTPCAIANSPTFNTNVITLNDPNNITATSNSNFDHSDIGQDVNDIAVRVVGALMRFRYVGSVLKTSGSATCLQDPTHASLQGRTQAQLDNEDQSRSIIIEKDWINLHYAPKNVAEYQFLTTAIPGTQRYPNIAAAVPHWYIGAWLSCTEAAKFEVEVWSVGEITGSPVTGQSLSHADPLALSAGVTAASAIMPNTASLPGLQKNLIDKATDYMVTGTSYVRSFQNLGSSVMKMGETLFGDTIKNLPAIAETFAAL